jgi:hypothetical protein
MLANYRSESSRGSEGTVRNSTFGPRKSTLKRSPFKQPDRQQFERNQEAKKRVGLKRKAKRATVAEGSKYLAACRGEECYLRIAGVCNGDWTTCVPAHRNEGKGIGLKVENFLTLPACYWCHAEFDQGKRFLREEKREMWNRAYAEWEPVRDRKMGLVEQQEMEAA